MTPRMIILYLKMFLVFSYMEVQAGFTELHNWDDTQVSVLNEAQMEDDLCF